jgi:hypothetical protein
MVRAGLRDDGWMPGRKAFAKFVAKNNLAVKKGENKSSLRKQAEASVHLSDFMVQLGDLYGRPVNPVTGEVGEGGSDFDPRLLFNADETMMQLYGSTAELLAPRDMRRVDGQRLDWCKKTSTLLPIISAAGKVCVSMLIFQSSSPVTSAERKRAAEHAAKAKKAEDELVAAIEQASVAASATSASLEGAGSSEAAAGGGSAGTSRGSRARVVPSVAGSGEPRGRDALVAKASEMTRQMEQLIHEAKAGGTADGVGENFRQVKQAYTQVRSRRREHEIALGRLRSARARVTKADADKRPESEV